MADAMQGTVYNPTFTEAVNEKQNATVEVGEMRDECDDEDEEEEEYYDTLDPESESEEDSYVEETVREDMIKFEDTFEGIGRRYKLINRIGEGTFSTVYKAEDLLYEQYYNDWDVDSPDACHWVSPAVNNTKHLPNPPYGQRRSRFVAIKKIYVTSSPIRIQNELELLDNLRFCKSVCPLITAFRHLDQVVAVLPYYRHQDFREFFRDMKVCDMQTYFRSLFRGLEAVHSAGILHRDIKPTNFLFDPRRGRGVLVDFGLAEREGAETSPCLCQDAPQRRKQRQEQSYVNRHPELSGFLKNDTRPSHRANRAGTRGFRAPEVLLKCTMQTTKIDIWSAGVILLTILSQRFPFFNSSDDVEALIEIATIWGQRRMKGAALLHGAVFECTIPTIGEKGYSLEKIIRWSTCKKGSGYDEGDSSGDLSEEELGAIKFLERCLELDPKRRISAKEALQHDFLVMRPNDGNQENGEEEEIMVS